MSQREESRSSPLRDEAEEKLIQSSEVSFDLTGKTPDEIIHELRVHQIELEIQNEALKKGHEDLEDSRDRYLDLYDFAPVGYFTLTKEALIAEANMTGAGMLGVVRKDLIHKPFRRFILPREHDQWVQFFQAVLKGGQRQSSELEIIRKDGSVLFVRLEGIRGETEVGSFQVRLAVIDNTGQRLVEDELQITQTRLESTMEGGSVAWWVMDCNTGAVRFNERKALMLGYLPRQFSHYTHFTSLVHVDDYEPLMQVMRDHLAGLTPRYDAVYRIRAQTGDYRWFHDIGKISDYTSDGKPLRVTGLAIDITSQKLAEIAFHEANQKLHLLTSLTRHDIINQVSAARRLLELATDTSDKTQISGYMARVREACRQIEETIGFTREYEDFGKNSAGWHRILPIIESAQIEMPFGTPAMDIHIPADLEIYAEPIIRKVFTTLIDNAVRHGGDITTISFSCLERENRLVITCEDDGSGITPEEKEHLFDQGFEKNTGIGLFLAREILTITDISIREVGIPGKGTKFEICVPAGKYRFVKNRERISDISPDIRMELVPDITPSIQKDTPGITEDSELPGQGISLLYIEDDINLLDVGRQILERQYGFDVTAAENAKDALHLLTERTYDAIISDSQMPKMNGLSLLKHLKKSGDATPFIILTGRGGEEVVIEALNTGVDFYILKGGDPKVQFADLTNKIQYAVSRRRTEKQLMRSQKKILEVIENLQLKEFAIESSLQGTALADLSGTLTFVNPAFLKMWGYDRQDEVLGRSVLSFWKNPEEAAPMMTGIHETGTWSGELTAARNDGTSMVLMVSANLIRDMSGVPVGMYGSFIDISNQKAMEESISASLHEKELLLREIHHRVKNNLQIIISLLNLQIRRLDQPEIIEALRDSQNRVKSMALVHEHLYRGGDISRIDLDNYISSLAAILFQNYEREGKRIRFENRCHHIQVDINLAIPLGLITNELITNSLKYAFTGKEEGTLSITATESPDTITLITADDGVGIGDVDCSAPATLGFRLVHDLTRQLKATMVIDKENGTRFTLVIPKTERKREG
ncbi:MAG: PAS domain S-box protein [Methanobacteriota archaeon]